MVALHEMVAIAHDHNDGLYTTQELMSWSKYIHHFTHLSQPIYGWNVHSHQNIYNLQSPFAMFNGHVHYSTI